MLKYKLESKSKKCYLRQFRRLVSPKNGYMLTVAIKALEKRCELCLKLTGKHQNDVIDFVLVSLLLSITYFTPLFSVSIVDFEQIIVSCENILCKCASLVFCSICSDREYNTVWYYPRPIRWQIHCTLAIMNSVEINGNIGKECVK